MSFLLRLLTEKSPPAIFATLPHSVLFACFDFSLSRAAAHVTLTYIMLIYAAGGECVWMRAAEIPVLPLLTGSV